MQYWGWVTGDGIVEGSASQRLATAGSHCLHPPRPRMEVMEKMVWSEPKIQVSLAGGRAPGAGITEEAQELRGRHHLKQKKVEIPGFSPPPTLQSSSGASSGQLYLGGKGAWEQAREPGKCSSLLSMGGQVKGKTDLRANSRITSMLPCDFFLNLCYQL